jgi:N-methylhydantoinase A
VGLDAALAQDGIDAADRSFQFTADMRSIGQYHELAIPLPRPMGSRWWRPERIAEAFHQAHESTYGHADATVPVEIVNLRAEAIGRTAKAEFPVLGEEVPRDPIPWARRRVFLDTVHGRRECAIFRRRDLRPGDRLTGPSIIVQMDTTVLILAGQEGRVTRHGVIRIQQGQPG